MKKKPLLAFALGCIAAAGVLYILWHPEGLFFLPDKYLRRRIGPFCPWTIGLPAGISLRNWEPWEASISPHLPMRSWTGMTNRPVCRS